MTCGPPTLRRRETDERALLTASGSNRYRASSQPNRSGGDRTRREPSPPCPRYTPRAGLLAWTHPARGMQRGDRRAAYLLLDESKPAIRRVEYNVDKEVKALSGCGLPHSDWVGKMLDSGCFQMP